MKTFSIYFAGLLLICLLIGTISCTKNETNTYNYDLRFISEEYQPMNYTENGQLTGLAPELLKIICNDLKIPFEVEMLPWTDGMMALKEDPHAVLFSTILNSERKNQFKWAGPFASLDWNFYSSSGNGLTISSFESARSVGKIGVLQDYSITQYLVSEGFTNLEYCVDNVDAFDKLLRNEIDLFPSDRITAEAALAQLGNSIYDITPQLVILTELVYFAFNKDIPDKVVADFQTRIDEAKRNGSLDALYQQYLQAARAPGTLQVYTEDYPPLTYRNSFGEITGFGTDVVREIMKRNSTYHDITLTLWSNGYNMALNNPSFCLFTMDRTPLREHLFQWVGPIGTNTTHIWLKTGSGLTINSLEDAKALESIATVSSWFSDQYLRELGFNNLVAETDPQLMVKKLMDGDVQAAVCSDVTFGDILKAAGYTYQQVEPAFDLLSSDYYIAFSKDTKVEVVSRWQYALQQVQNDGTFDAIHHKWFPYGK